jgi:hypothetical protein
MNDNDWRSIPDFPPEEFQVQLIDLPDGGVTARINITGRTRELVKLQAAAHGMSMEEWVGHWIERDLSLRLGTGPEGRA